MSVYGYYDVFPDRLRTDLRIAIIDDTEPADPLSGGTFWFTEYYCTNPSCNCQRVIVKVLRLDSDDAPPEEVATISYSWGTRDGQLWAMLGVSQSDA